MTSRGVAFARGAITLSLVEAMERASLALLRQRKLQKTRVPEERMTRAFARLFSAQMRALEPELEQLSPLLEAGVPGDMEDALNEVAASMSPGVEKTTADALMLSIRAGANAVLDDIDDIGFQASFDLANPRAVEFARAQAATLVSGVNAETKDILRGIITRAVDSGQSYQKTTKEIRDRFDGMTTKRARLIAITETGNAYCAGSIEQGKYLQKNGVLLEKSWLTVGDIRVDDVVCLPNGAAGWIPFDDDFPSGHERPTGHPGCRCDVLMRRAPSMPSPGPSVASGTYRDAKPGDFDDWLANDTEYAFHGAEMTPEERWAVGYYSSSQQVVKNIRDGKRKDIAETLDNITGRHSLNDNTMLYRGLSWKKGAPDYEALKNSAGTIISDKGFASATFDPQVATRFSMGEFAGGSQGAMFEIRAPKGFKGAYLEGGTEFRGASEWLMPRGQKFRVVSVEERSKYDWMTTKGGLTEGEGGVLTQTKIASSTAPKGGIAREVFDKSTPKQIEITRAGYKDQIPTKFQPQDEVTAAIGQNTARSFEEIPRLKRDKYLHVVLEPVDE